MDILPQLLINALITGSIYALASSGLSLTYSLLKIINFAHGHLMMTGAYLFYLFWILLGFPLILSIFCTLACSVVIGGVAMKLCVEPFKRLSTLLPFVTTLALASILEAIISMTFGVNVKSLSNGEFFQSYDYGWFVITKTQVVIISLSLFIMLLAACIMHCTPLGRKLRAIAQNSSAAQSLGISEKRFSYAIFCISVMLASVAGIMVGFETNIQPTMGSAFSIKASAAMILGGLGNLWGTIFGSYLLGIVENLGIGLDFGGYSLPAGYKDAFSFFIILLVLLFKPAGIFSSRKRTV